MKEHPPPPLPPKDAATTPLIERPPPPAVFFNRSSPTPLASSIAQRRLQQKKPMGLQLGTAVGSPLASAGLLPPPPLATATGTWTLKTPAAIPDAQHTGRHHHHESSGKRVPPIGSNDSSGRLARAVATPATLPGIPVPTFCGDTQESLKSFEEAVNASALSSSFALRSSLLSTSAVSHLPKPEMRKAPTNKSGSSKQSQKQHKRVSGLNFLGSAMLASKLSERAAGATNSGGVVIDMRKSADYINSHITSAIGMTAPTTLVKRPNFSIQRLLALLHPTEAERQLAAQWKQAPWVIIYGEGTPEETASEDALLVSLARKFMSEAPDACCVYVLEGGYTEFSRLHPALCEFNTSATPGGELLPTVNLSLPTQGVRPTVDLNHPMLRKMRQTPGGGFDPNEVISMRMPPEFAALKSLSTSTPPSTAMEPAELPALASSAAAPLTPRGFASLDEMQLKVLPAYLRLVANPDTGPGILMKLYAFLDSAENQRIITMIGDHGVVTENNRYTISAGIELGTKNRYTNILPFDSTRVKLQRRWSRLAAGSRTDKGKAAVGRSGNVNKPLPPLPPGTPLAAVGDIAPVGTPIGGISGSAAHLRLRMQGDRPVSYDHSAALAGTPTQLASPLFGGGEGTTGSQQMTMLMAKRSSQRVDIGKKGKGSLIGDYDDDGHHAAVDMDGSSGADVADFWSTVSAGSGGDSSESDYINASYLSYFGGPLYIAAQGPLPETMGDFWHMVWEQKSRVVVMLTKNAEHGRAKCHQYWPISLGGSMTYGEIEVVFEAEALHPDDHSVVARRLKLTNAGSSVIVTHLQYLGWPDHGVPENPLGVLRLRQLARRAQTEAEVEHSAGRRIPMVVHCSAGCGRTGAFCAIDTLLTFAETQPMVAGLDADGDVSMDNGDDEPAQLKQQSHTGPVPQALRSESNSSLDSNSAGQSLGGWVEEPPIELRDNLVFMVVARFREQRMMSVQTGRQFAFCHETLAWALLGVGPRPLDRAIDRRLVSEWNRAHYPKLSVKDCTDITYLMRGRCEMVSALQQQPAAAAAAAAATTPGGCGAEGDGSVAASRASVDISGSPAVIAPPMLKRSNTVGAARRGLFGSIFRPGSNSDKAAASSPGAVAAATGDSDTRQVKEMELVSSVIMANSEQLSAVAEEELSAGSNTAERPLPPFPTTCGAEVLDSSNDYFGNVPSGASDSFGGSSGGGSFQVLSAGSDGQAQTPTATEWRRNMLGRSHLESDEYGHSPHAHLNPHQLHLHYHAASAASNSGTTPLASPSALASPRVK